LAHTADSVIRQGLPSLAPFFQADLGLSRAQVGLFMTAMSLGGVMTLLPAGWLTDLVGARRMFLVGLALTGFGVAIASRANSFEAAFLLLFLSGLGHGFVSPGTTKAIMYWFTARRRGTAMGLKQTGVPLGGIIGAAVLPALALALHWRWALLLLGLLVVAAGLMAYALCRDFPAQARALAVEPHFSLRQLFTHPELLRVSVMAMVFSGVQMALVTHLVLYLNEGLHWPVVVAGRYLALAQAGGMAGRVMWGLASDRLWGGARRPVLQLIGTLSCLLALTMALATPFLPPAALALVVFLFGFCAIGWNGLYMALLGEIAGKEATGTATGVSLVFTSGGTMGGPPLFGYLVDRTGSYTMAWLALALAAGLATWRVVSRLQERLGHS